MRDCFYELYELKLHSCVNVHAKMVYCFWVLSGLMSHIILYNSEYLFCWFGLTIIFFVDAVSLINCKILPAKTKNCIQQARLDWTTQNSRFNTNSAEENLVLTTQSWWFFWILKFTNERSAKFEERVKSFGTNLPRGRLKMWIAKTSLQAEIQKSEFLVHA